MTSRGDRLRDVHSGDRWLVIVAHPDDEAFGCGSLIAHAASHGADVTVLCATRGEAGEPNDASSADLGATRAKELLDAVEVLGGGNVELLDYADSGFDGDLLAGSLCATELGLLVDVLLARIGAVGPTMVVVLDGSDGHRDHLKLRDGVIRALGRYGGDVSLYEHCLPNSLMRRWLEEMRQRRPETAYHGIQPGSFGRPDAEITDVLDVHHVLAAREAAVAAHRSQISPFDGLSEELRHAFLSQDHLAQVTLSPR